jgi:stage II sporulation protein AA (anti-sigma F factor antagonist)
MTAPGVTVTARSDGDTVLIMVQGEVDLANAEFVERQIAAAISNRTMSAAVDLTSVSYVDSIGMRVLFELATRLQTAQIALKLIAPMGSPARRVIEISGLDSVVDVEPRV